MNNTRWHNEGGSEVIQSHKYTDTENLSVRKGENYFKKLLRFNLCHKFPVKRIDTCVTKTSTRIYIYS